MTHFFRLSFAAALLLGSALAWPAHATNTPPPISNTAGQGALSQTVREGEALATGRATVARGHVDLAPRIVNGQWTFLARDDSGTSPIWRRPGDVVLQVPDAVALPIPATPEYAFLGVPGGTSVHVVPQTENPQVVWLGWNTQDPAAQALMGRGAHLQLTHLEGPGHLALFLQDGSFGKPRPLWDSRQALPQKVWAEANTHVHANWMFSQPGAYRVGLTWSATTTDGRALTASGTLRFAVGAVGIARSAELAALPDLNAAAPSAPAPGATTGAAPTSQAPATPAESSRTPDHEVPWVIVTAVGGAVLLGVATLLVWRTRSRLAREEAEMEAWAAHQERTAQAESSWEASC